MALKSDVVLLKERLAEIEERSTESFSTLEKIKTGEIKIPAAKDVGRE